MGQSPLPWHTLKVGQFQLKTAKYDTFLAIKIVDYKNIDLDLTSLLKLIMLQIQFFRRCDLHQYFSNFTFIPYSSAHNFSITSHLFPIFRNHSVPESSLQYIQSSLSSGRTAHSTVDSKATSFIEKRLKSSPYLMELLVKMFYHDFKLFNFTLPAIWTFFLLWSSRITIRVFRHGNISTWELSKYFQLKKYFISIELYFVRWQSFWYLLCGKRYTALAEGHLY